MGPETGAQHIRNLESKNVIGVNAAAETTTTTVALVIVVDVEPERKRNSTQKNTENVKRKLVGRGVVVVVTTAAEYS